LKFSLRTRVLGIPLVLVALSVSLLMAGFFWLVAGMWQAQLHDLSISQEGLANKGFKSLEKQAITIAAMASRVPGVQEAYRLAREGKEEEGRKTLRKGFDRIHKQVTQALRVKISKYISICRRPKVSYASGVKMEKRMAATIWDSGTLFRQRDAL
jgi:hypothetical protein